MTTLTPQDAFNTYLMPYIADEDWILHGAEVDPELLPVKRRELLGCILMAHLYQAIRGDEGEWLVGYDEAVSEPNDGLVTDHADTYIMEHKIITKYQGRTTVQEIVDYYDEYNVSGA